MTVFDARGEEVEKEDTEEVKEMRREGDFRAEEVFKPFLSTLSASVLPEDPPLSCRSTLPPPSLTGGRWRLTNQRRLSVSPKLYDISPTWLSYSLRLMDRSLLGSQRRAQRRGRHSRDKSDRN